MEPCIPYNLVPRHLRDWFERGLLTSTQWAHLIINAYPHDSLKNTKGSGDDKVAGGEEIFDGDALSNEGMDEEETLKDFAEDEQQDAVKLVWDDDLESNPINWRPTARAHCIAIKFLQQAISKSYVEKKRFCEMMEGRLTRAVRNQLGDLEQIVRDHGSILAALANALSCGITTAEDMSKIQACLAGFKAQIQAFVNEALVSKEYLLGIVTQVLDVAQEGPDRSNECMDWVEQLFEQGVWRAGGLQPQVTRPGVATRRIRSGDPTAPIPPPHITRMASVGGIDADMPLDTVQIGRCDTPLSATLLFQMIRELQAQVAILTERSKNSGVIFDWMAFASEAEFAIWLA
jgi:hypothetical protein